MQREDEWNEFKKTTGELNEAMVSIAAMLNKHQKGKVYFGEDYGLPGSTCPDFGKHDSV